ncbi:MAG TPA: molybdopterin-binding protein [Acidimicrobiia bacterium]
MIVEVIAVGTELLIGQITNTNASLIGARLAEEGFDAHYQVTVGDNLGRLAGAIEAALERSDAVLITGGIGPTQDDLTREAICQVTGRVMTRDPEHEAWIKDRLRAQRRSVPDNVLRMADLPEGAEAMPNSNGAALGVALQHRGKWLLALPGVPAEMRAMLDSGVLPRLHQSSGSSATLHSRLLHTWGLGESEVADRLDDLFATVNPSVAFLIRDMEVRVRISAKAEDQETARLLIAPIEEEIRARLGAAVFAVDGETVEDLIVVRLGSLGWAVGTIEQATLGQVGARIAEHDRSVFAGTVIVGREGGEVTAPIADVVLTVGPIGGEVSPGRRITRAVEMTVTTPDWATTRVFDLGGDDERVRSFATIAGLHLIRTAVESPDGGT